MADITLAEFNGRCWLVGGEPFLDGLLANTLPSDVSIELVPCESKSAVLQLWTQISGSQVVGGDPWFIHPNIVERIRRKTSGHSVFFAEWSAMIDEEAKTVIASAAAWALQHVEAPIELVEFVEGDAPRSILDLAALRSNLIEDRMVDHGIPRERVARSKKAPGDVAGVAKESQRIDIVVRVPEPPAS